MAYNPETGNTLNMSADEYLSKVQSGEYVMNPSDFEMLGGSNLTAQMMGAGGSGAGNNPQSYGGGGIPAPPTSQNGEPTGTKSASGNTKWVMNNIVDSTGWSGGVTPQTVQEQLGVDMETFDNYVQQLKNAGWSGSGGAIAEAWEHFKGGGGSQGGQGGGEGGGSGGGEGGGGSGGGYQQSGAPQWNAEQAWADWEKQFEKVKQEWANSETIQIPDSPYEAIYMELYNKWGARTEELYPLLSEAANMIPTAEDEANAKKIVAPVWKEIDKQKTQKETEWIQYMAKNGMLGSSAAMSNMMSDLEEYDNAKQEILMPVLQYYPAQRFSNLGQMMGITLPTALTGLAGATTLGETTRQMRVAADELQLKLEQNRGQALANMRYGTGERFGAQEFGVSERLGTQDWTSYENMLSRQWQSGESEASRGWATSEREAGQTWQDYWKNREIDLAKSLGSQQKENSIWGSIGSIVGTGLGFALAPATGGASLLGSAMGQALKFTV